MKEGELVKDRMNLLIQEKTKREHLVVLRRDTLRRIEYIRKKAVIEHKEVYYTIRDFFKEFLEQRYEFTTTELRAELKKVYISSATRQQINDILDTLQAIEYANVHYEKTDLLKILNAFETIVTQLVRTHINTKSIWTHLTSFFIKEEDPATILADLPVVEQNDEYHIRIEVLVERCYIALEKHQIHRAKVAYKKLLEEYAILDETRKKQHYHLLEQTYHDIINRAKMTK